VTIEAPWDPWWFDPPTFAERLPTGDTLVVAGIAEVTVTAGRLTEPFRGDFSLFSASPSAGAQTAYCASDQVEFVR